MDNTVDGVRYRQPLETTNWQEARKREKELIKQAALGLLAAKTADFARLGFSEAADRYQASRPKETIK